MTTTLFTAQGASVQLGRALGKGGEGTVYEVPSIPAQVAKVYNPSHRPDSLKQSKLKYMCATGDPQLLEFVAWPLATLHAARGGPAVGFLMPKVSGRDPVHMVYSPAHRMQERPKAAWDFLLYVARNTAAAFEALHSHGHVLGDVNQGNVMVGNDSKVVLIDSDSFQVDEHGTKHLCEVGVAHFTPPELQGMASFKSLARTSNHDNFGLALLIFHLLYAGRHPFAGVPLRAGVGDSLEGDIKAYRFAYGRDAQSRGSAPPPRTPPLSLVPEYLAAMFETAFTERGAAGSRPTAGQWKASLDQLRNHLRKCSASGMHVYPDHLSSCPWCALEKQAVVYFLDSSEAALAAPHDFDINRAWALIEAAPAPAPLTVPALHGISVTPRPLPAEIPGKIRVGATRALIVGVAIAAMSAAPKAWFFIAAAAGVGWLWAGGSSASLMQAERRRRDATRSQAQNEFDTLVKRAQGEAGAEPFVRKKDELRRLRDEYRALPAQEAKDLEQLKTTAQARQLKKFLERIYLDSADIPGVGPGRKATLRSFGIETAADVSRNRVLQVRGFGESLTRALTDWRATCERRFVFNPALAVTDADKQAVRAKLASRRLALTALLRAGPAELQKLRQATTLQAAAYQPRLAAAAKKLAQARADLEALD